MPNNNMFSEQILESFWDGVDDHTLDTFKHCVWVLVSIYVLRIFIEIIKLFRVGVELCKSLSDFLVLVLRVNYESVLDLLRSRWVEELVVPIP